MKRQKNIVYIIIIVLICLLVGILLIRNQKWVQDGLTITKGNEVLSIGDIYNYDETKGGKIKGLTDVKWRVLGVSDSGELLIISTTNVDKVTLGLENDLEATQDDYKNGIEKLNNLAKEYGKGKKATGARSIMIEDINNLLNYKYENFNDGELLEYGNEVSYYWSKDSSVKYESSNKITGALTKEHDVFIWFDKENNYFKKSIKSNQIGEENITTIRNDWYTYNVEGLMDEESNIYKMLFGKSEDDVLTSYWLASPFTMTSPSFVGYGYQNVIGSDINYSYLVYSFGVTRSRTLGLRVVVSIR